MRILLIETATKVCSVALAEDGAVREKYESAEADAHSTLLPLFVRDILPEKLDAVCISAGPGSYTGLRIGTSTAKGICYAREVPLLSVPTLYSMALLYKKNNPEYEGMICPMIDARRMECYTMMVSSRLEVERDTQADIITEGIYDDYLERGRVVFIGDGAEKTRPILGKSENALFEGCFVPSAEGMAEMAFEKMRRGEIEDVAYFEPFYLKDFVAKKSVVHGLR